MIKKALPDAGTRSRATRGNLHKLVNVDDTTEDAGKEMPRRRDRTRTLIELQLALRTLQERGAKITLAAVSREAAVSPALIHNRYPDFAEQVRLVIGRSVRRQRDDTAAELFAAKENNRKLNRLIKEQHGKIIQLASINEALVKELAILGAIAEGKVARGKFGKNALAPVPSKPEPEPEPEP